MNSQENASLKPEVKLIDIPITDDNVALNVLVQFLHLAQKRGAFAMDESAKIWECVKVFHRPPPNQTI